MDADELLSALSRLSLAAAGPFEMEDILRALCEAAAEALAVDAAGVMIRRGDRNAFLFATADDIKPLEAFQETAQQGPCVAAVEGLAPVLVADLSVERRWPEYRALSKQHAIGSVVAVPLLSRDRVWGALDLYRREPGRWQEKDLQMTAALADIAVTYLVMAEDRVRAEAVQDRLAYRALHDDLTGLPNRALLFDRLGHALAAAGRREGAVAVIFLDLDRFKEVNDTLGHQAGDDLLVAVATRLTGALRDADTLARLSGDEFVVVCEGLPSEDPTTLAGYATALAARLQRVLHAPFRIGGSEVVSSASVGVAVATDGPSAEDLLADADAAMYAAKLAGGSQVRVREDNRPGRGARPHQLARQLVGALDRDELTVHYQPIVSAATYEIVAVEALLRWQHPDLGLLPADDFLEFVHGAGLSGRIGRLVIGRTCEQLRSWVDSAVPMGDDLVAFVNIGAAELSDGSLSAVLAAGLEAYGLRPGQLGLELVEHDLRDIDVTARLEALAAVGHPLSIDDFGTGYSSLSRLVDLRAGYAKIDRTVVAQLPADVRRARFVQSVLTMAESLDIQVIAEGVETAAQARHLTDAGCHLLQGFLFGRPQSAAELAARPDVVPIPR